MAVCTLVGQRNPRRQPFTYFFAKEFQANTCFSNSFVWYANINNFKKTGVLTPGINNLANLCLAKGYSNVCLHTTAQDFAVVSVKSRSNINSYDRAGVLR